MIDLRLQGKYTMADWWRFEPCICKEKRGHAIAILKKGITLAEFLSLKQVKVEDRYWITTNLLWLDHDRIMKLQQLIIDHIYPDWVGARYFFGYSTLKSMLEEQPHQRKPLACLLRKFVKSLFNKQREGTKR